MMWCTEIYDLIYKYVHSLCTTSHLRYYSERLYTGGYMYLFIYLLIILIHLYVYKNRVVVYLLQ
jgi:hypothetical protein